MLNRVRSVIRANSISNQGLDPKGLLQMSREEYAEHEAELQRISDEFDARKIALAGISAEELDDLVAERHIDEICEALAG